MGKNITDTAALKSRVLFGSRKAFLLVFRTFCKSWEPTLMVLVLLPHRGKYWIPLAHKQMSILEFVLCCTSYVQVVSHRNQRVSEDLDKLRRPFSPGLCPVVSSVPHCREGVWILPHLDAVPLNICGLMRKGLNMSADVNTCVRLSWKLTQRLKATDWKPRWCHGVRWCHFYSCTTFVNVPFANMLGINVCSWKGKNTILLRSLSSSVQSQSQERIALF